MRADIGEFGVGCAVENDELSPLITETVPLGYCELGGGGVVFLNLVDSAVDDSDCCCCCGEAGRVLRFVPLRRFVVIVDV